MERYPGLNDAKIERWLDAMVEQQTWLLPLPEMPPDALAPLQELLEKSVELQHHLFYWSTYEEDEVNLHRWIAGGSIYRFMSEYAEVYGSSDFLEESKWNRLNIGALLESRGDLHKANPFNTTCIDTDISSMFMLLAHWLGHGDAHMRDLARGILRLNMYALPVGMSRNHVFLLRF